MRSTANQLLQQAVIAHQQGDHRNAEALYRKILAFEPDDIDVCNLLGMLLVEQKQPKQAVDLLRNSLRQRADDGSVHYNLGLAYKDLDDSKSAIEHFRQAARLLRADPDAPAALGNMLRVSGKLEPAIASFRNALTIDEQHAGAQHGLADALNDQAVALNQQGSTDDAIKLLRQAVEANSANVEAQMNLGVLLEQIGRSDLAAGAIQSAIAGKPDFAAAHFQLAHLRDHDSSDEELEAMIAVFQQESLPARDLARLAYGIAKVQEKRADYDVEFDWLVRAHEFMHKDSDYDAEIQNRLVDNLLGSFRTSKSIPGADQLPGTANIIFVTGMPRSGTTLTEQILASHPKVYGSGEHSLISEAAVALRGTTDSDAWLATSVKVAEKLASFADGSAFVVDNTPTNFLHIGLIARLLPRSRIIHCTRHPLDTCLSIYQHPLSQVHDYAHRSEDLASYYTNYRRLMDHWTDVLPGRIYQQSYEATVSDLESSVRSLLNYCGLDLDPACLNFHETDRVIKTPSASQVRMPLYASSVGRWRRYESQLAPLKQQLEQSLNENLD